MSTCVLNIIGLIVSSFSAALLALFGVSFHGNQPGVQPPGKVWQKLHLTSVEGAQRLGFVSLAIGFVVQLIAHIL